MKKITLLCSLLFAFHLSFGQKAIHLPVIPFAKIDSFVVAIERHTSTDSTTYGISDTALTNFISRSIGGGGGSQGLNSVLTVSNDAGGLDVRNVKTLQVKDTIISKNDSIIVTTLSKSAFLNIQGGKLILYSSSTPYVSISDASLPTSCVLTDFVDDIGIMGNAGSGYTIPAGSLGSSPTLGQVLSITSTSGALPALGFTTPAAGIQNNPTGSRIPTTTDDNTKGYAIFSQWYYNGTVYICTGAVTNSAVWHSVLFGN